MPLHLPHFQPLRALSADGWRLFATRGLRLFAYGFLSVVLVLYLRALGLDDQRVGWLLTLTLLGDTVISLWITTRADRGGRRKMLILGAVLMFLAGLVFLVTRGVVESSRVGAVAHVLAVDRPLGQVLSAWRRSGGTVPGRNVATAGRWRRAPWRRTRARFRLGRC